MQGAQGKEKPVALLTEQGHRLPSMVLWLLLDEDLHVPRAEGQ